MLFSMTGFGAALCREDTLTVSVEIKTVNNRYLKLVSRLPDGYASLEGRIEAIVRESVGRGTVNLTVRIRRENGESDYQINGAVLQAYARQLAALEPNAPKPQLDRMLRLPGVIEELAEDATEKAGRAWPLVEITLRTALEELRTMRLTEGTSMGRDLSANLAELIDHLTVIEQLAPNVVEQYRGRLTERLETVMKERNLALADADLVREIALFADRCDISEETVRLRSHLEQFRETLEQENASGRKLDFLTQELFRETNTIGSKANDAEITRHVVDMKSVIERIREMVQNIE